MGTPDRVNADFDERVVLSTGEHDWIASPQQGVERRLLDRVGGEVARATSLVRFAPESYFPPHVHGGGEEYLVLDGVFSDESGDYPAGSYVRNPPGSKHKPHTEGGCTIFVKLRQMKPQDEAHVVIDTSTCGGWQRRGPGQRVLELFAAPDGEETVTIEELAPGGRHETAEAVGGEELLVLSGTLEDEHGTYGEGVWVRNPPGFVRSLVSALGCRFWRKQGHLSNVVSS